MLHLITGGSGSGKSRYAEGEILKLGPGRRIYIATMYPSDEESRQRIAGIGLCGRRKILKP